MPLSITGRIRILGMGIRINYICNKKIEMETGRKIAINEMAPKYTTSLKQTLARPSRIINIASKRRKLKNNQKINMRKLY